MGSLYQDDDANGYPEFFCERTGQRRYNPEPSGAALELRVVGIFIEHWQELPDHSLQRQHHQPRKDSNQTVRQPVVQVGLHLNNWLSNSLIGVFAGLMVLTLQGMVRKFLPVLNKNPNNPELQSGPAWF